MNLKHKKITISKRKNNKYRNFFQTLLTFNSYNRILYRDKRKKYTRPKEKSPVPERVY